MAGLEGSCQPRGVGLPSSRRSKKKRDKAKTTPVADPPLEDGDTAAAPTKTIRIDWKREHAPHAAYLQAQFASYYKARGDARDAIIEKAARHFEANMPDPRINIGGWDEAGFIILLYMTMC